jgi:type IV pilus assembly protein PilC
VFGRTRRGAALVATIVRRTPLVGPIWRDMAHIRFVRILGTLWKAGVPPMEALQVAAQTTDDYRFINQIGELQGRLSQGSQLSGIIGATNYLPDEVLYMLQTGETTGDVSQSLDTIADYYDVELQAKVKTLPTKLMLLYYAITVPIIAILMFLFYMGQYGDVIKMLK